MIKPTKKDCDKVKKLKHKLSELQEKIVTADYEKSQKYLTNFFSYRHDLHEIYRQYGEQLFNE